MKFNSNNNNTKLVILVIYKISRLTLDDRGVWILWLEGRIFGSSNSINDAVGDVGSAEVQAA